ncbi:FAD-dependent monooxygenase [Sphingomonas sp.]|uniref:FAD-dependent monooxygenase n=1 Tax=Sphingomonas sp. TaxID=28214 RepID=UPI00345CEA74
MQHTQVLVIGGSLVGLSATVFLAAQGVEAITIERHMAPTPASTTCTTSHGNWPRSLRARPRQHYSTATMLSGDL